MSPTKTIMLSAGEASGDLHGASLIESLKAREFNARYVALGGDKIKQAGAQLLRDNNDLAVIGLFEIIKHYPTLKKALTELQDYLRQSPPDLIILIDYVEFNLKLAATAKSLGIPVLFYVSPQVWAWRPKRVEKIGQCIDMMAAILPFEVDFYHQHNIPVRYVGNPLVGKVKASRSKADNIARFGLAQDRPIIGLLPGSRRSEIARLLPLFLETASQLKEKHPELQFILPVASSLDITEIRQKIPTTLNITLLEKQSPYDCMQVCDSILSASGTATLQTALMQIPLTMAYKVSPLSYPILKRMIKIPNLALANIVAGRAVIREHIQNKATVENLVTEIEELTFNKPYREKVLKGLADIKQKLGDKKGSEEMAILVEQILSGHCEELA